MTSGPATSTYHGGAVILTLAIAATGTSAAFPSCTRAPIGCYADSGKRAVTYLLSPPAGDPTLTLESCALNAAANGFLFFGVTGHGSPNPAAYCYGDVELHTATLAPSSSCNVPCPGPGGSGESCGGQGFTSVFNLTCDGPLPPAPVGPPLAPGRACSQPETRNLPFCNPSLALEARVADLVSRVALTEIGAQLTARESPAIARLGIPAFYWGTNAIHGITNGAGCINGTCPTSWPDGVAMAASWNMTAWQLMGKVTGVELRAYDNIVWSLQSQPSGGLTAWGPTINLFRDPRWGRGQESAGECPYMSGKYGASVARGLQNGTDPRFLLAVATLKHLAAYSLEDYDNHEWMRQTFDAEVTPFDFADSYSKPFERAIQEGGAAGVMYAANSLDGVPCAGSTTLDGYLHSWGFDGYRTTDGGQIINMVVGHHYVPTLDQAIGLAVAAESDIADGTEYLTDLVTAVLNGNTTVEGAQRLLANTLRIRFRLGLFDPPQDQPYLQLGFSDIASPEARAGTALASREALVLLKNEGKTLPLQSAQPGAPQHGGRVARRVAVVGPNANSTAVLQGNYGGQFCPNGPHGPETTCLPSIFQALQVYAPDATWVQGSGTDEPITGGIADAVASVAGADAVIFIGGLDQTLEREQLDRVNITLPPAQMALYEAVAGAAAQQVPPVPVIVVLVHGGAIALPEVAANASAILDAFYPGVTGGPAVADALFGAYSPGGRMPYTVYGPEAQAEFNFTHMGIANASVDGTSGRTYRYYRGTPIWPFGFGLSYSSWALQWAAPAPPSVVTLSPSSPSFSFALSLSNAGPFTGDAVVQLYFTPIPGSFGAREPPYLPLRQLFGFQRLLLGAGNSTAWAAAVSLADIQVTTPELTREALPGLYNVSATLGDGERANCLSFTVQVLAESRR